MPILPRDFARCDGVLPKQTQLNGKTVTAWIVDCPCRESCARFCQNERDDPAKTYTYTAHHHAPSEPCPSFIKE